MSLSDVCIRRPVLTWMMTLSLVVFGALGYVRLGVDQFPNKDFPVVTVTAALEGASPEVVEEDVTEVLEEQLNTIAGLRSLRSTSTWGSGMIVTEFELGRDIDLAAQDVRDKVGVARARLPRDVEPPIVEKLDFGDEPIMWIPIKTDRSPVETSEYVRRFLKPSFETIPDVASVLLFGRLDRAIRIWLDGDALRARGLAAGDVLSAIRREHVEVPGGRIESEALEYTVKTDAEFASVEDLEGLVVAYADGAAVRLGDVARVEDGAADRETVARFDGVPTVGIGIKKQAGANTVAIADEVYERIDRLRGQLPTGMGFKTDEGVADFSVPIREAVDETLFALFFGAILATLTVFVFLRRTRPTMIVAVAIPVSLVATFGVMWMAGYTLNTMTLLALALAVGVVIDDAIIVLENIERRREQGEGPLEAASRGTSQIAFAATAATVSIAVVFLPVVFTKGRVGSFLSEFGVTVAASVLFSLFVALTLTPMLAARMPPPRERSHGGVYHRLEQAFEWLERSYRRLLEWVVAHRVKTLGIGVASFAATLLLISPLSGLGREFFPPADNSMFFVRFETPPGTSLDTTLEFLDRNEDFVLSLPEHAGLFTAVGVGQHRGPGTSNEGIMFVILKSLRDRERRVQELVELTREELGKIPGQKVRVFDLSNMASGIGEAFSFELRGNVDPEELDRVADAFIADLEARGGFVDLDKSLRLGLPEVRVIPDREKAAALGVDAASLATTVQAMIGGLDVATFKEAGQRYDIRVRLEQEHRADPEAIGGLFVRTRDGDVVELRNLVRIETGAAPSEITRHDRQRSVSITGNLEEGFTLQQAIVAGREAAARVLPEAIGFTLSGEAEEYEEGGSEFALALGLSILIIYMVLAAQFESLMHPITVMFALIPAMLGALGALWIFDMTINLFSMIGIILLMGLVTKNSILLVDFANQLRAEGLEKTEAMLRAAPARMRPVLMTALSMVFGVLPAAVGVGPGAETRQPMGVAVAAGMFTSTFLTLLVVPGFYLALDDLKEWLGRAARRALKRPALELPAGS